MAIQEIRILPPLAVARLGSSPEPMQNYGLVEQDGVNPREIVPAETLLVNDQGEISAMHDQHINFRDAHGRIKPVSPFFEVWARTDADADWHPLTEDLLAQENCGTDAVKWSVHVANIKVHRRTNDPNDRVEAKVGPFSDHLPHALHGTCPNFLEAEFVPLGSVQYVKPSKRFPGIRIRFTPAAGKVYGASGFGDDANVVKVVYDSKKGKWPGYREPDSPANDYEGRRLTNPAEIFAGYDDSGFHISYGYIDDECDGVIEAEIESGGRTLRAFARVAAGPPTFAPDSKPVRTVADELEQALLGPEAEASDAEVESVRDLVRRALETVRLMNTGQMNKGGTTRGVGMARMDALDVSRQSEPIFDPAVADSLAIRARHERVLLALESGSLAWFARVLREYDKVGDLTDEGRHKMPGMMRNADGRHLALTRRQVSKVRAVAEYIIHRGARPEPSAKAKPPTRVQPLNLTAQLEYRAEGNPPNTQPDSAISNAYPGLEMDFRNVWRRILEGLVLHESLNFVLDAERDDLQPLKGMLVTEIAGVQLTAPITGPGNNGVVGPLKDAFGNDRMALEWSNALADVVRRHTGEEVLCRFQSLDGKQTAERSLRVRPFFEAGTAVIARDIAEPGALNQSLCAPWQNY
jgi:hypothetical protein